MIPGTSYSPAKAFIDFAKAFLEALANEDFNAALRKLDVSERRWSKVDVVKELDRVLLGRKVCSAIGCKKSASPELIDLNDGHYELRHKIPVESGWSNATVTFVFKQKPNTGYFHVYLKEFQP